MDEEVAGWIIEFLVRQRVDPKVVDNLLSTLSVPRHDPRFNRVLLLHCIQSEVSSHTDTVSDKILDLLVLVRTLDFSQAKLVSEAMKTAFYAVFVDCTRSNSENDMKTTWRDRVRKIEESEAAALISDKLLQWMEDASAIGDTRNEALEAVEAYLHEAWSDMGPSVIVNAAEDVIKMGGGAKDDPKPTDVEDLDNAAAAQRPNVVGRFNVMERKPGACAYEWEELEEDAAARPHNRSIGREKKSKRWWTSAEEDTLRKGVKEFGVGSWAAILAKYRHQFQGRTAVNLKDKWRTITKLTLPWHTNQM